MPASAPALLPSPARPCPPQSTASSGEEYYARLQAFVDELKSMPVAVQVRRGGGEGRRGLEGAGQGRRAEMPTAGVISQLIIESAPARPAAAAAARPAPQTAAANEQHYEVPTPYFLKVLGKHLKYSSCIYATPATTLDEAEQAMLGALRCGRAALRGAGLGWGCAALMPHPPKVWGPPPGAGAACRTERCCFCAWLFGSTSFISLPLRIHILPSPLRLPRVPRRAVLRARRPGGGAEHPGAGVRVGVAVALHGGAVPPQYRHRPQQLAHPEGTHRRPGQVRVYSNDIRYIRYK